MVEKRRATSKQGHDDPYPEIKLKVSADGVLFFTTILQSGIEIESAVNTSLGDFLSHCPGLSEAYLSKTVQTIFLNSTPLDDLQTPLRGRHPVVALSAAMPGLAGAIFRKNSRHSALRTTAPAAIPQTQGPMTVTLKLFNRIAQEKGPGLLATGVVMASATLVAHLTRRPELLAAIQHATINADTISPADLTRQVRDHELIKLFVTTGNQ